MAAVEDGNGAFDRRVRNHVAERRHFLWVRLADTFQREIGGLAGRSDGSPEQRIALQGRIPYGLGVKCRGIPFYMGEPDGGDSLGECEHAEPECDGPSTGCPDPWGGDGEQPGCDRCDGEPGPVRRQRDFAGEYHGSCHRKPEDRRGKPRTRCRTLKLHP